MHRKFLQMAQTNQEEREEALKNDIGNLIKATVKRSEMKETFAKGFHLAEILKTLGWEKWGLSANATGVVLWAKVQKKEDIEAFNKIIWSFGFKHKSTNSNDSVDCTFTLDDFNLQVYYFFGDDAECKMVQIGTKEVPVFQRQCGNTKFELEELEDDREAAA